MGASYVFFSERPKGETCPLTPLAALLVASMTERGNPTNACNHSMSARVPCDVGTGKATSFRTPALIVLCIVPFCLQWTKRRTDS